VTQSCLWLSAHIQVTRLSLLSAGWHDSVCGTALVSKPRWSSFYLTDARCGQTLRYHTHTRAHTHPFNGPLSGTTRVSRYQNGKTNLDFTKARDSDWQWHQLGHMQVCTLLQTDNHASTSLLSFCRPDALPAAQPTASKHWRQQALQYHINFFIMT